jgi:hypothetical protein
LAGQSHEHCERRPQADQCISHSKIFNPHSNDRCHLSLAQTELIINNMVARNPNLKRALIQTLLIQIELIEAMKNPEAPG